MLKFLSKKCDNHQIYNFCVYRNKKMLCKKFVKYTSMGNVMKAATTPNKLL